MDFKLHIGEKIKKIRKDNNLKQIDFCNMLNIDITNASLSNIENGKHMPSAEFIKAVVETFGISPYWILDIKPAAIDQRILRYELLNDEEKETLYKYIDFLLEMSNKMNP